MKPGMNTGDGESRESISPSGTRGCEPHRQGPFPERIQIPQYQGPRFRDYDELPSDPAEAMVRTVTLAAQRLHAAQRIDMEQLRFMQRSEVYAARLLEFGEIMTLHVLAIAYGKEHPRRDVIRYPADWWQAFKERWAPVWFRTLYPVIYTEVTASLWETYPDVAPAMPEKRHTFTFATHHRDYPIDF